jgi:hypothetical protein
VNKQITDWPVSLIVAIAVTLGCGFVLNTYWDTAIGDLGDLGLPQIMVLVAGLVALAVWAETFRSYQHYKAQKSATRVPFVSGQKMNWPEPPNKKTTNIEPEHKQIRVFKIDD